MSHWYVYALHEKGDAEYRYIGVTSQTPKARLSGHFKQARSGHLSHKCNWIRQVGYASVVMSIVQEVLEGEEAKLHFAEILWIHVAKSCGMRLTNGTEGGLPALGFRHTEDTRKKIGVQSSGRNTGTQHWTYGLSTENHPSYGSKRSDDTRKRQSESLTGRTLSDKHRANISTNHADVSGVNNPFFGKSHTDDSKSKMSSAKKGKALSENTRQRMSESHKGVPKPHNARSSHTRWHTNKNISKPETCTYCKDTIDKGSNQLEPDRRSG